MSIRTLLKHKSAQVFTITPDKTASDCIALFNEKRIGTLLVVDANGELLGIVSERDVLRKGFGPDGALRNVPVSKAMTPRKNLITTHPDASLKEVMETMTNRRVRHVPVMENDRLVGLVSIGDIVKALLDEAVNENKLLKDYISGTYA